MTGETITIMIYAFVFFFVVFLFTLLFASSCFKVVEDKTFEKKKRIIYLIKGILMIVVFLVVIAIFVFIQNLYIKSLVSALCVAVILSDRLYSPQNSESKADELFFKTFIKNVVDAKLSLFPWKLALYTCYVGCLIWSQLYEFEIVSLLPEIVKVHEYSIVLYLAINELWKNRFSDAKRLRVLLAEYYEQQQNEVAEKDINHEIQI